MILNVVNFAVLAVIGILAILAILHLFIVYRKSPCGDCSSKKECTAFSKKKILKEYKKACKRGL